jgi:hypothetical protein
VILLAVTDDWDLMVPSAGLMPFGVYIVRACLDVVLGIIGIINRRRLEKASLLKILGGIDVGLTILASIATVMFFAVHIINIINTLLFSAIGIMLPIVYFIGASKNLKAYRNSQNI